MQPAGWYPDPCGLDAMRWWDGLGWAEAVAYRSQKVKPPKPPHPQLPMVAALGALGTVLISLVVSRYVLDYVARFHWPIAAYVVFTGLVGYGPAMAFCWAASNKWGSGSLRSDSGFFFRWADTGWGPVTWLSCMAAQVAVAVVIAIVGIPITSNLEGVDDLPADRGYVIALLVLAVVAAPVIEEIVFRGIVMRGLLSRFGAVPTVAIQAVVFGMAHFDPVRGKGNIGLIMVLSSVGAVLGGAQYLFRRLGPTIVAHAIINAVAMTIALNGWVAGS